MTSEPPPERATLLLRERVQRVFRELPFALAGHEEPIHQLRVATRRLRVTLPLLAPVGSGKRSARALRVLRQLTRAVAPARDLDVLAGLLEDRFAAAPKLGSEQRALLGALRRARTRSREPLASAVLDLDIDGLRRDLRRLQRASPPPAAVALARAVAFREAQSAALLRTFSELGERFLPELLHALRRRIRRLRYAAEVDDLLRGETSRAPLLWKRLQETIGAIHDHHVLAVWLDAQARAALARGRQPLARAAQRERRLVLAEARRIHAGFLRTRPADLALRALDASARRQARRAPAKEGGDAASDHPPRDRGAARNAGDPGREAAADAGGKDPLP